MYYKSEKMKEFPTFSCQIDNLTKEELLELCKKQNEFIWEIAKEYNLLEIEHRCFNEVHEKTIAGLSKELREIKENVFFHGVVDYD